MNDFLKFFFQGASIVLFVRCLLKGDHSGAAIAALAIIESTK